jgi:predicted RND superfamily exporter protein
MWAEFILRYRWPILLVNICVTALMAHEVLTKIKVDNSNEAFLANRTESMKVLEQMWKDFGNDAIYQVLIEGDVFSLDYLDRLERLHRELEQLNIDFDKINQQNSFLLIFKGKSPTERSAEFAEEKTTLVIEGFEDDEGWGDMSGGTVIERIVSLWNVRETRFENDALTVRGLLEDRPNRKQLAALKKRVLSNKTLVGQVVGRQGRHSVIYFKTERMDERASALVYEEVLRIVDKHQAKGFKISVAGSTPLSVSLNELMMRDFEVLTVIALSVIVLVMTFIYRHPLGVLGPVLVVIQAGTWMLGCMAYSETPMTMVTNVLPGFLACAAIGDSIHIQSVYRGARARGIAHREAIVHAVSSTFIPIFYTSLTTAAGLLSFRFANLDAIVNMGTFGALAIGAAFIESLVFLPVVLSFNSKSLFGVKANSAGFDWRDRFLSFCNNLSRDQVTEAGVSSRRRRTTLTVAVLITATAAWGASRLTVYHNPMTWLPKELPARRALHDMDDNVGGVASVAILIEARPGTTLKDRELLLGLEKLERYIEAYRNKTDGKPIVSTIMSVLDVVRESYKAIHGSDPAYYRIPDTQRGVVDMFTLFENSAPEELRTLATVDFTKALMTVRVKWLDAWAYGPLTDHIERGVERFIGQKATVKMTGSVYSVYRVVGSLLKNLLVSFGTAFIVITITMIILLRNLKLGLISMVPNLLPVVAVMGFMGFVGIPIDMANLITASIIISIAVDDTIHFLHHYRIHYTAHGKVDDAIDHAFVHTGRAILSTSTILVLGFSVFLTASMYPLMRFGVLAGIAIIFALLYDIILSPALLRALYRDTK